jgi:hypothetical protein
LTLSGSSTRRDSTKPDSLSPESEASRSTARPPANDEDDVDLAAAIRAAKINASPGRYGPPAATAKIRPFQLAEALARLSADVDPSSIPPPPESERSASPSRSTEEAAKAEAIQFMSVPTTSGAVAKTDQAPPEEEPAADADAKAVEKNKEEPVAKEEEEPVAKEEEPVAKEEEPVAKEAAAPEDDKRVGKGLRVPPPSTKLTYFILAIGLVLIAVAYVISNR